jgi:four helix bundle protein
MEPITLGMHDFTQLKVWVRSHRLTLAVYKDTVSFPKEEQYGLKSQIRRSCASIPANIAEGCGRGTNADLARFLQIALGSASELQNHLRLAHDLSILEPRDHERLSREVTEIKRMLTSFIENLKAFAKQT